MLNVCSANIHIVFCSSLAFIWPRSTLSCFTFTAKGLSGRGRYGLIFCRCASSFLCPFRSGAHPCGGNLFRL